jgi:probable F420-dependent oxidoreductase
MEWGIQLVNMEWARLRDTAQAAEGLGFDMVTFPDHIVFEGPEGQYDPQHLSYDAIVIAAVVAEATKRMRIGHLVLCNLFRHPAITAQSLTSLDQLSGGRIVAGLGTGWTASEFRMTGIPYPDIATRLRMLDEALTCLRSLWTKEQTTFAGEFYRFEDAILWPKPVQKPHPPILLGGSGKGLLRLAAKHADAINIISEVGTKGRITMKNVARFDADSFREKVEFVRTEARQHGRDAKAIRISNVIFTLMVTDSAAATRQTAEAMAPMFSVTPDVLLRTPLVLIGTPEECVAELKRRQREWDVSQVIFSGGAEQQMERLAKEVMPFVD